MSDAADRIIAMAEQAKAEAVELVRARIASLTERAEKAEAAVAVWQGLQEGTALVIKQLEAELAQARKLPSEEEAADAMVRGLRAFQKMRGHTELDGSPLAESFDGLSPDEKVCVLSGARAVLALLKREG